MSTDDSLKKNKHIDGRSLRRTGRTVQFSTRVRPEFKDDLAEAVNITGKRYNEIVEESLKLFLENAKSK